MQPGLAGLVGQGLQPARQFVRFGPRDHRVPDHVAAGGELLQALLQAGAHPGVIGLDLVARVHQHQPAARGRRQQGAQALEAVFPLERDLAVVLELLHVGGQRLAVGRMQLEQPQLVARLLAQQRLRDEGRAGVDLRLALRVERGDELQVVGHQRRRVGRERAREQLEDAVLRLAGGAGEVAVQPVQSGAGMGVDHRDGRGLGREVLQHRDQHHVLEDVGVVAGMEAVAVAEHRGGMVAGVRLRLTASLQDRRPRKVGWR